MDRMRDVICGNDWHSLFCSSSGPEPCENRDEVGNRDEGPLFRPKTSRSHLLIKLREVTPGEKLDGRLEMSMKTRLFSHFATNQKYPHCEVSCCLNSIFPQASQELNPSQLSILSDGEKREESITIMIRFSAVLQTERALWLGVKKNLFSIHSLSHTSFKNIWNLWTI